MTVEIWGLTLTQTAEGIRGKRFSSTEVTRACIERAQGLQQRLNAFIAIDAEGALRAAEKADAALARGQVLGPLHGVPLAHKDTYYRKGRRATCGSMMRRDFVPDRTATTLARLDAAGAVDLGGVNTSDSGCNPFGLNLLVGRARNPWNPDYITGGSSSGSGAAIAARLAFGSMGSDSGGSVRLPAAMCGVVGLKPTDGRISRFGIMPLSYTLDCPGPVARTAADCARITGAVAGQDPLDPKTSPEPVPDYEATLDRHIGGRRIGVASNYFSEGVAEDVKAAVERSLEVFRELGAEIVEIPVPDPAPMDVLGNVIVFAEGARVHERWLRERAEDYTPVTRWALEFGLALSATRYLEALTYRGKALQAFLEQVFTRVDAFHTPVMPGPVPSMAEVEVYLQNRGQLPLDLARNTKPATYMGLPALSVPCGFSQNGLPVGFQLMGPPFSEALLFNLAHLYQSATDHHARIPDEARDLPPVPQASVASGMAGAGPRPTWLTRKTVVHTSEAGTHDTAN
jgi:aspartyl-tRNA(Asn)/glutamyl-tRNA(Gln) amidotransferase subunit A